MADAAEMLARCFERQQGHAPCLAEAQPRGSEDVSWKVGDTYIAKTDHGVEGVRDLPPDPTTAYGDCGS